MRFEFSRTFLILSTLVVVSAVYGVLYDHASGQWEDRTEAALTQAALYGVRADSAIAAAASIGGVAIWLALAAEGRAQGARERVVVVDTVVVPAPCVPFTAPRDTIIDTLFVAVDTWRTAFDEGIAANTLLRDGLTLVTESRDSLALVLADRPGRRQWWVPQLGMGGFAGVCTDLRSCAGVGLTLSWEH